VTNLEAYELTDGPIDEYPWDEFTVYDDAQNPGTFGGFRVYKSANTHADGSGGLVDWFVWNRNLSLNPGVTNFPRWAKASDGPIGDYMKRGGPPATLGTATTTYGPTDHSEESGSAGLGTDGSSGYIDLKTEYDYLNGLRDGKFGIVSVFEMITKNDASRVYSTETSSDVGMSLRSSTSNLRMLWNGTNGLSEIWPSDAGVLKCTLLTTDIGNSDDIWVFEDGAQVDTDDTVNGLIPGQSTLLTLASKAYTHTSTTETKFGPQILMDFADVIAVDAAWSLGLSQAINAVTSFDPHDIAAAIAAYDSNITGHYYANNELASGDASDYYLLAYDIETQTAITQGVYGLTSPSGVTGTVLVPVPVTGGNSIFGTKGSVLGPYRSIYTDTRKSWLGPVKSILGGN
jgi:hypothetical protein